MLSNSILQIFVPVLSLLLSLPPSPHRSSDQVLNTRSNFCSCLVSSFGPAPATGPVLRPLSLFASLLLPSVGLLLPLPFLFVPLSLVAWAGFWFVGCETGFEAEEGGGGPFIKEPMLGMVLA